MKDCILIVEDDPEITELLELALTGEGFKAIAFCEAAPALAFLETNDVDLVLMDLGLPDMDGVEAIEIIDSDVVPVIVMTVRNHINQKVAAYSRGIVDYVTKPFDPRELVLRIRSALNRNGGSREKIVHYRNLRVDLNARSAAAEGMPITLTPKEFDLLLHFLRNTGAALERRMILQKVWGMHHEVSTRTLDTHVRRLRSKIPELAITTLHGTGYRLEPS